MTDLATTRIAGAGVEADTAPRAGTVLLDKYRVERTIGAGGMATVVSATHLKLHERVAIKLPHRALILRPRAVERFLQEARVSSRLRGEHAVRVFDVGALSDGRPYLVMEYLAGADLRSLLAQRGSFPIATAVDYVLQACEAVAEAHAQGVVHCDIKPANLFLTRRVDGSACIKVLDFGISKMLDASRFAVDLDETAPESDRPGVAAVSRARPGESDVTGTRGILGSPRYMAPEQIGAVGELDARVDLWALGVVLFELLEGRPPFPAEDAEALREAIARSPVPPLASSRPPEPLALIVRRCLEKEAARRFANVHELAVALAPFGSRDPDAVGARIGRVLHGSGGDMEDAPASTASLVATGGPNRSGSSGGGELKSGAARAQWTLGGVLLVGVLSGLVFSVARGRREAPIVPSQPALAMTASSPLVQVPAPEQTVATLPRPVPSAPLAPASPAPRDPPARRQTAGGAHPHPSASQDPATARPALPMEKPGSSLFDTPD